MIRVQHSKNPLVFVTDKLWALSVKAYTLGCRPFFKRLDSYIDPRVDVTNPEFVSIGRGVVVRPHSWIYAICDDTDVKDAFDPVLEIGDGCSIGRFCHITASEKLVLEKQVLLGEGVYLSDTMHGFNDVGKAIMLQPVVRDGPLRIGEGTWVGNGAMIVGGVNVGRQCVVGANAVVTRDVPDCSVVVGVPGRVVKAYDVGRNSWVAVTEGADKQRNTRRRRRQ